MYLNELGDEIREVRETLVFTPNVYWRSAHNLVSQTDWVNLSVKVATTTPSSDVCMQQIFTKNGLEPPPCLHKTAQINSAAFCEKLSPQSEKRTEIVQGTTNWLTMAKGKLIPPGFQSYLKCNFLSAKVDPH